MSRTFDADDKSAGTTRRHFLRGTAAAAAPAEAGTAAISNPLTNITAASALSPFIPSLPFLIEF